MRRKATEAGELMGRLADSDPRALEQLYAEYGAMVFGIALKIVGDRQLAEEVAEDAFVSAWRGSATYAAERGDVAAWLGRIARNRAIDALRRSRAGVELGREDWSELPDPKAVEPGEEMSRSLRANAVREAVAQLPEAQRSLLSLAFFRGLSHSEIAAATSLPLGTVKSRIRDAMLFLRERLGEEGLE